MAKKKTLSLKKAKLLLVQKYLSWRRADKKLAPKLLKEVESATLITPVQDFLLDHDVVVETRTAYIHAQMLDIRLANLETLAPVQDLTEADCTFEGDGSARKAAEEAWGVAEAERIGEGSYGGTI